MKSIRLFTLVVLFATLASAQILLSSVANVGVIPRSPVRPFAGQGSSLLPRWTNITGSAKSTPSKRYEFGFAFDKADGYAVLFGGVAGSVELGDTWIFKAGDWTQLNPTQSPSARSYISESMVYDEAGGYVLLFGGLSSTSNSVLGDTWIFKAGQWTQLNPPQAPAARGLSTMAYDEGDGYVVLFGGCAAGCGLSSWYTDTWKFSGGTWTQLSPTTNPSSRGNTQAAYDALDNYVLLFGGQDITGRGGAPGLGDTWQFKGGQWTQLSPSSNPDPRAYGAMAFDESSNSALLFGGLGINYVRLNDTWSFSQGQWTNLTSTLDSGPTGGDGSVQVYDDRDGYDVLFNGLQADTWTFGVPPPAPPFNCEYDSNSGGLPDQACPAWELTNTETQKAPILSGGSLIVNTTSPSNFMFYKQSGSNLSFPANSEIQVRMKVVSDSESVNFRAGAWIEFVPAPYTGNTLYIGLDNVFLLTGPSSVGQSASVDTHLSFHTYTITVSSTGAVQVYQDEALILTGTTYYNTSPTDNGPIPLIEFGEGGGAAYGASEWQFVHHNAHASGCVKCNSGPSVLAIGQPLSVPIGITLSKDGKTLFVSDYGAGAIFSIPSTGGSPSVLASGGQLAGTGVLRGITISPDGNTLYFIGQSIASIMSLPSLGGTPAVIASGSPFLGPHGVAVSPDGSTLYIADNIAGAVFSLPVTGGAAKLLASGPPFGTGSSGPDDVKVSPDGSTLFVDSGPAGIFALPSTGGTPILLESLSGPLSPFGVALSSDGKKLYFLAADYAFTGIPIEILVMPTSGGIATPLLSGPPMVHGGFLVLSHDDKTVYLSDNGGLSYFPDQPGRVLSQTLPTQCCNPPTGLVSWWPGEGNANDALGTNNGKLIGGVSFAPGIVGQAFSFNGINQYDDLGNSSSLQVSHGNFTADAWVEFNAVAGDMSIIDKMSGNGVGQNGWRLLKQLDNRLWFCLGGGSSNGCSGATGAFGLLPTTVTSVTTVSAGIWYNVAAVKSSSSISIYIDGNLEGTNTFPSFTDTNSTDLLIGATAGQLANSAFLNGLVDEAEIYNRALTGSEIQTIFHAGSVGKCHCGLRPSGLVNWWPGDGNANDIVGGNDGALVNGAGFASGEVNQAFSFNGVNQYMQTVNPVPFGSRDFSVDLWANFNSIPSSGIGNPGSIFISDDNGSGCTDKWFFALGGGVLNFHINSPGCVGSGFFAQYPWSPNTHQWYNLAVTRSAGNITIFVDGARVSSELTSATSNPTTPVTVGFGEAASGYFDGLIDEIQIYNRALGAPEIQRISSNSFGGCNCVHPPSGLVSWWQGEGSSSDTLNRNAGVIEGGVTFAGAEVGQGFRFNGVDGDVRIHDTSTLNFGLSDSFSLDFWVQATNVPQAAAVSSAAGMYVLNKQGQSNLPGYQSAILVNGSITFFVADGVNSAFVVSTKSILDGSFHHIALVRDKIVGQITIYVDGTLDKSVADSTSSLVNSLDMFIGARDPSVGSNNRSFFNGTIDELDLYSRVLTQSEVQSIFNAGTFGKCKAVTFPPLLAHVYDLQGNFLDRFGGPALVPIGGTIGPTGYSFGPDQGLTLSGGLPDTQSYSVGLIFNWTTVPATNWYKIVDFQNRTSDDGLYTYVDSLQFYPENPGPSGVFHTGEMMNVFLTRDGASGTVAGYINGAQQFSFDDTTGIGVPASNLLIFFVDDTVTAGREAGSGLVEQLCIYSRALSSSEIAAVTTGPCSARPSIHDTATTVSCNGPVQLDASDMCTVTVTDTNSSSPSAPTGSVDFTSDSQGSFTGSPCRLSGSGSTSSCQVTYTPSVVGSGIHTIKGVYSGDLIHLTSSGQTSLTVTSPLAVTVICDSATVGKPVNCTTSATGGTGGFTFSWAAAGGSPTTGSGPSFSTTYANKGSQIVTVTATDSVSATVQSSTTFIVAAQPLVVNVSCGTATVGKTLACTAVATGGTGPYSFSWSSNGNPSAGTGPGYSTSFASKGSQTVTVSATDANGFSSSGSASVTVTPQPLTVTVVCPTSGLSAGKPFLCTASESGGTGPYAGTGSFSITQPVKGTFTETFSVTDANGVTASGSAIVTIAPQPLTVTVDCGSGQTVDKPFSCTVSATGGTPPYTGTGTISRTEATKGTKTESFTVTDANSVRATGSASVTITVQPLTITVSCPTTGLAAGKVFQCTVSAAGGTAPYTGTGPQTVTQAAKGTFTETFSVTDANQASASGSAIVIVAPQPLGSDFTSVPSSPTSGQSVSFSATATGGTASYSFTWNFGDSSPSLTGNSVQHTFTVTSATNFDVVVTAKDANGITATASHSITVSPIPLHATALRLTCTPRSVDVNQPTDCNFTITDTTSNPTTPQGTVSFSSDNAGTFAPGTICTLSQGIAPLGSSGCEISYTPTAVGSGVHTITATYSGDSLHALSVISTGLNVNGHAEVKCGGDDTCTVKSNSTITKADADKNKIRLTATGAKGTVGWANVTLPRAAVPNIDKLQVRVDGVKIPRSSIIIKMDPVNFYVYFTFTFHSPVNIEVEYSPSPVTILGLDPNLFYASFAGLVVAVIAGVAVSLARRRPGPKLAWAST